MLDDGCRYQTLTRIRNPHNRHRYYVRSNKFSFKYKENKNEKFFFSFDFLFLEFRVHIDTIVDRRHDSIGSTWRI